MTKAFMLSSAVAFALGAAGAGPASAQPEVDVLGQRLEADRLTVRVGFADLDLASAAGQDRLTTRVRGAVRQVCAPLDQAGQRIEHTHCGYVAWKDARPQMAKAFARARQAAVSGQADTAVASIVVAAPAKL